MPIRLGRPWGCWLVWVLFIIIVFFFFVSKSVFLVFGVEVQRAPVVGDIQQACALETLKSCDIIVHSIPRHYYLARGGESP